MITKRRITAVVWVVARLLFLVGFAVVHAICTYVLAIVNSWYDQWTTPGTLLIHRAFEVSTFLFRWLPPADPAHFDGVRRIFLLNGLIWALVILAIGEGTARLFVVVLRAMGVIPPKMGSDAPTGRVSDVSRSGREKMLSTPAAELRCR